MAEWDRALDWQPGGPVFESCCGNFASNFGNSVYPALPVSFGGDTKGPFKCYVTQVEWRVQFSGKKVLRRCKVQRY